MGEMKDRMERGELYVADDPELNDDHSRGQALLERYNALPDARRDERFAVLRELLAEVGEGVVVRPPFNVDYGSRITIGAGTFVNSGCMILDGAPVTIGEACQLAPNVCLTAAEHPIDPGPRRAGWESVRPIVIEDNVWLGVGVIVCPGVTIGRDTVVGAGAVVVRDLPPGVVAVGVPARPIRFIGGADRVAVPER